MCGLNCGPPLSNMQLRRIQNSNSVASTLVYDTFASPNEQEQEITWEDVDELEALLKSEPSIRELNSTAQAVTSKPHSIWLT